MDTLPAQADSVIETIRAAFGPIPFPGAPFLQGSFEGDEPEQEVGPFASQPNWQTPEPGFLDAHSSALSFFSEAGFRFFLPAYLIADLKDQLQVADPLFHLTHGFYDMAVDAPVGSRVFSIKSGKSTFLNPQRYGAATFGDHARYKLSIFTREEAGAIVAYLLYKRDQANATTLDVSSINAALDEYWLERARTAPTAEMLARHLAEQKEFIESIQSQAQNTGQL